MSDILLEVDEALRTQQIKALWSKYGHMVVGAALMAVVGTAIGAAWHGIANSRLEDQTRALKAAVDKGDLDAIKAAAGDADKPLWAVGQLYVGQKQEQAKDLKAAGATYEMLRNVSGVPDVLRDLGTVHAVRIGLLTGERNMEDLLADIDPLTKPNSGYQHSAMELKALVLQKLDRNADANAVLEQLSLDGTAPDSVRQRARALMK